MTNIDENSTHMDDIPSNDGPTEQDLLDAVMANSPIMDEVGVPLPDEETEVDPVESEEVVEDPEESDEAVEDDVDEEEVEELEEEDAVEETATQDPDVFTADDLDLDAQVRVKIDGEEVDVSFGDLLKGYQTDSHLSKKGRELGEAAKAFEEERNAQMAEVQKMGEASAAVLMNAEQVKAKEYHDIEAKIEKAREEGDTYELNELKDKKEVIQKQYWNARKQREGLMQQLEAQKAQQQEAEWKAQLDYFNETIPTLIPDFNEERATSIREFALEYGFKPEVLDTITDPLIVKFIDEFRELKSGVSKGAAKRKAAPAKKAVPTKKAQPAKKKAADAEKMRKARAFKENASKEDQDAFLRDYAARSLNL